MPVRRPAASPDFRPAVPWSALQAEPGPRPSSKRSIVMIQLPRLPRWQTSLAFLFLAATGVAQGSPTIGSPNTATADPAVARPATTPCAVQLFPGPPFAAFPPNPFTYAP